MDRANLVAHGEADQVIIRVKHHKDLVNAQLLCGRGPPIGIFVRAALKGDGLTPLVAPGLYGALRGGDGVFTVRRGGDHCTERRRGDGEGGGGFIFLTGFRQPIGKGCLRFLS